MAGSGSAAGSDVTSGFGSGVGTVVGRATTTSFFGAVAVETTAGFGAGVEGGDFLATVVVAGRTIADGNGDECSRGGEYNPNTLKSISNGVSKIESIVHRGRCLD